MTEHHPPRSESDQDETLQLLEQLGEIFKCTICLMKLDDPRLCPQCSKLYCYDCISEWFQCKSEQHLHCPNCACELQLDKLVKIRWFEEAEKLQRNYLERTAQKSSTTSSDDIIKNEDVCLKHLKDIIFYCCTCDLFACYECAKEHHRDHTFKIIDVIYGDNLQVVEGELEKVRLHKNKVASLVDKVKHNVDLVNKVEELKLQEIREFAKRATEDIANQANHMRRKLECFKSGLMTEMKDIEQSLLALEEEVKMSSQHQFISKKPRIIKECNKIMMNPIKDLRRTRVKVSLKYQIPIIYETGIFVIENYSSSLDTEKIDSVDIPDNFGHIWRIYVDCHTTKGELGIFLDLVEGLPCRVDFHLQLLHADREQIIQKEAMCQFDNTLRSLHVYPNFIPLKTISNGNYLKDDSLEFLYKIRPRS